MKNTIKRIVVDPSCLLGILTSCIEVYPNEVTGLLAGRMARRIVKGRLGSCTVLSAAQPVQTAKRARNGVDPKDNGAAYTRARTSIGATGFQLIGGYHSHPNSHTRLSKSDLEWCRGEMEELKQLELFHTPSHWLELVIRIEKQLYVRQQARQLVLWETPSALSGVVKIDTETGYHITMRGYYFDTGAFRRVPFKLSYSRN